MSWISDFIRNPFSLTHNLICLRSGEKGPTHFFLLIFHFHLKSTYYSIKCRVIFIKCESKNIFFLYQKVLCMICISLMQTISNFFIVLFELHEMFSLANLNVWRGQGLIFFGGELASFFIIWFKYTMLTES